MISDPQDREPSAEEVARREDETLKRLLSTPPDPKTKRETSANPKKRGRPKTEFKETKDRK